MILLPCPFCGAQPPDPDDIYDVECPNTDCILYCAIFDTELTQQELIEKWNTRDESNNSIS
jgi:hypothetical protein